MESYENNENREIPFAEVEPQPVVYFNAQPETPAEPENLIPAETPANNGKKSRKWLAIVLVLALLVSCCGGVAYVVSEHFEERLEWQEERLEDALEELERQLEKKGNNSPQIQHGSSTVVISDQTPAQVYADNADSVVLIKSQIAAYGFNSGGTSTGSGFILTPDGYVVTNYHVIEGGSKLYVVTSDNREYPAELVGYDNANDVALLKVEAENLPAVVLGDSDSLLVGEQVVAIGNPLGELTSTLTVGYVSAKERDVNTSGFAINMIQTDAAINSGNSGGPLFNMAGQVVGITTAKYSGSSSSGATIEGIGFAIPINDVSKLLEDLATKGYVSGAYLGVSVSDMDAQAADYYGMPLGAYVSEVVEGNCAHAAGIRPKDIITAVGEYAVEGVNDLSRALRNFEAGDTVVITVYRSGAELKLEVTLDEKPQEVVDTGMTELPDNSNSGWPESLFPGLG